ncbi:MAG: nicotinate phosphoribosyltransferase [Sphingobacteriales bacterium]|nr:MAG: nicotinate phosphoribosyltransferase [Sphingobacteriales bacterium]
MNNILLQTDVYKMGHMEQYAPGCNKVYSYLTARDGKTFDKTLFFGLQYYIKRYLAQPVMVEMGEEFLQYRKMILGSNSAEVEQKMRALCRLGYLPLEIKAVEEGTVLPVKNVLMTITNTHPDFYWVVGFVESILLKLWYTITVATCSYHYREVVDRYFELTDDGTMKDFQVHDFGYRGDASEEGAAISGVAHLLSFLGSDNVPALPCAIEYYNAGTSEPIMLSVPASEHSVMCSFGREDELGAFRHMLEVYPTGIVSIVSDTFNVYRVLTEFVAALKEEILSRDGKVVFRPDSGNPEHIICGDPEAPEGSNEWKGAIRLLDEAFGSTVNSKGYKVLHPKVGLIYGDGMYLQRYERTLERLKEMGYAAGNLIIGVGGILRNHSRDTLGFAIKATYVEVNGEPREIEKDPVTDHKKKSHKGLLALVKDGDEYITMDRCTTEQEQNSLLKIVFKDGVLVRGTSLGEIRGRVKG